jgi:hypothetical protein
MRSPAQRAELAERGRELVAARYDWATVGSDLRRLVETVR